MMKTHMLLTRSGLRYWNKHRWQAILMLVGMALGVAVVFAVDIANHSAKRAFALSLDTVTGRTTHQLTGGTEGIDESLYTSLRTEYGFRSSAPIVEGTITLSSKTDKNYSESLTLLGVDIFAEPQFRDQSSGGNSSTRDALGLLKPGAVILGDTTAERLGVKPGDSISLKDKANNSWQLISTVDTDEQPGFENFAMVDISTAQNTLGMAGKLTRIDLILPRYKSSTNNIGASDQTEQLEKDIDLLRIAFPELTLNEATRQNNSLTEMTAAFHTNLLAMSLLALLVGAFLIYNTVTLSVIQRRTMFGQLRAVGVLRHELFGSILIETLAFALIGTVAGILLGALLGSILLSLVTRTINDLYFTLDVKQVTYSGLTVAKACVIGLGVSLIAALAPALEASNNTPASVIRRMSVERRVFKLVPVMFITGIAIMLAGIAILGISSTSLWAGFIALFFIVLGYSLLIPQVMIAITSIASYPGLHRSNGNLGNYPLRSMTASLSRTAVAIAALSVSVSATAGVGIMIGSFRLSVENWLQNTLQADVYISATSSDAQQDAVVPADLPEKIRNLESVSGIREARMTQVQTDLTPARLMAIRSRDNASLSYQFKQSSKPHDKDQTDQQRIQALFSSDSVIAAESFAYKHNLQSGDTINLTTDHGMVPFSVAGVFTNYTTGKGLLVMSLDNYRQHWNDNRLDSLGVYFSETADSNMVEQQLRPLLQQYRDPLMMRSDAEIRDQSLQIFDRTFAITHVLRLLTVGVAFVGILSALMALSLERRSEYAVLRALGITPAQLRRILFTQTGLMGIIAGLLALPLGIAMSQILVSIINVRSFGWSMEYSISTRVLLESMALAIIAALLAGLYPAHKLSRLSAAEALRHQ